MRLTALLALTLLAGCSAPKREAAAPVEVVEEPAAVVETDCQVGDDDGIGGTGCQID